MLFISYNCVIPGAHKPTHAGKTHSMLRLPPHFHNSALSDSEQCNIYAQTLPAHSPLVPHLLLGPILNVGPGLLGPVSCLLRLALCRRQNTGGWGAAGQVLLWLPFACAPCLHKAACSCAHNDCCICKKGSLLCHGLVIPSPLTARLPWQLRILTKRSCSILTWTSQRADTASSPLTAPAQ